LRGQKHQRRSEAFKTKARRANGGRDGLTDLDDAIEIASSVARVVIPISMIPISMMMSDAGSASAQL
jgi:hypothetical protein